jgi:hypothetical protein
MRLLVTGGAGYIGSVVSARLIADGHQVVVLDDLSTGHADAIPVGAGFVPGDLRSEAGRVLAGGIDAVLHFAAKSLMAESVARPDLYWSSNLGGTLALLEAMRVAGVSRIVFSSTAAGCAVTAPLQALAPGRLEGWAAYPAGVAWALLSAGHRVSGASLAIDADLAAGAGLSSSAALECAAGLALADLYGLAVPRPELAALSRRAENDFVGAPTGLKDQLAVLLSQPGHALLLDCRAGGTGSGAGLHCLERRKAVLEDDYLIFRVRGSSRVMVAAGHQVGRCRPGPACRGYCFW